MGEYIFLSQGALNLGPIGILAPITPLNLVSHSAGIANLSTGVRIDVPGIYMASWSVPALFAGAVPAAPNNNIVIGLRNVSTGATLAVSAINPIDIIGGGAQEPRMNSGSAIFTISAAGQIVELFNASNGPLNIANLAGAAGFPPANGGMTLTIHQIGPVK